MNIFLLRTCCGYLCKQKKTQKLSHNLTWALVRFHRKGPFREMSEYVKGDGEEPGSTVKESQREEISIQLTCAFRSALS